MRHIYYYHRTLKYIFFNIINSHWPPECRWQFIRPWSHHELFFQNSDFTGIVPHVMQFFPGVLLPQADLAKFNFRPLKLTTKNVLIPRMQVHIILNNYGITKQKIYLAFIDNFLITCVLLWRSYRNKIESKISLGLQNAELWPPECRWNKVWLHTQDGTTILQNSNTFKP